MPDCWLFDTRTLSTGLVEGKKLHWVIRQVNNNTHTLTQKSLPGESESAARASRSQRGQRPGKRETETGYRWRRESRLPGRRCHLGSWRHTCAPGLRRWDDRTGLIDFVCKSSGSSDWPEMSGCPTYGGLHSIRDYLCVCLCL